MNENDEKPAEYSKITAKEIYQEYFTLNDGRSIISIEGTFGSGKTTAKEELKKLLKKDAFIFNCLNSADFKHLKYKLNPEDENHSSIKDGYYFSKEETKCILVIDGEKTELQISSGCEKNLEKIMNGDFLEYSDAHKYFSNAKNSKKKIIVDYNALQFEEKSQITSQLYMAIAEQLSCGNRFNFRAASILKKENLESSYITGSFGVIALILFLLHFVSVRIFKDYPDVKFILALIALISCYSARDFLVKLIAGFIPRYTHTNVLKKLNKTEFEDKELVILIDEIDRLDSAGIKLLLDELLIITETFEKSNIPHKILIFNNPEMIRLSLKDIIGDNVDFYLQKYKESLFTIYKPDLSHMLAEIIFTLKSNKAFSQQDDNNIESKYASKNIFATDHSQGHAQNPSFSIIQIVDYSLASFRDLDRFIEHLKNVGYQIQNSLTRNIGENNKLIAQSRDNGGNAPKMSMQYCIDILMAIAFLDFKYQIRLTLLFDKNATEDRFIKEFFDALSNVIKATYEIDLTASEEDIKNHNIKIIKDFEKYYFIKSRVYPSKIIDYGAGKVELIPEMENRLENIFVNSNKNNTNNNNEKNSDE